MSMTRSLVLVALLGPACSASSDSGDDGPPLTCPEPGAGGALRFDGVDDYATTGLRPELGLETFTIEAWVRREGDGVAMTSGNGGLRLVPIAAKGLGEGDGSNVDCNYVFGFWGDVVGADFEDQATGANHPIIGKTAITRDVWHHVAATYDGAKWKLFVDGVLDAEMIANARPRADSIHPFGLGSALDSAGLPHGFLHGSLDEVRVWNQARTIDDIKDGMYRTVAQADGLVGRWALDADAADPALTIEGASSIGESVTLDQGTPPIVASMTPADGAMMGPDVTLDLMFDCSGKY